MTIPKIQITINNNNHLVRSNVSVLQACEEAGYNIPRFCYHEKLSVAGNCRMCLVEIQKSPKPVVSCAMPVNKGMVIYTETPLVKKAREAVLELLLINHPLDCPICDQGGECDLQDETLQFASDRGRYHEYKRSVEDKECGPVIKTIMTRCIHCTRCICFSSEITGQEGMGAFGRGQDTEIGIYIQSFIKTELSGNLVDLCPVGALTSKPYAFTARSWELQKFETIDFFDTMCSDILVQTRQLGTSKFDKGKTSIISKEEIVRILPRDNGIYTENWINDKTRYAFDGLRNNRALEPYQNNKQSRSIEKNWSEVLINISERLEPNFYQFFENLNSNYVPLRIATILGSLNDIESLNVMFNFTKLWGSCDIQYGNFKHNVNIDIPFFCNYNNRISFVNNSGLGALIMIGCNPRFEASLLNISLRKLQNKEALSYTTLGAFNNLRLNQNHVGNSVRSLLLLTENKLKTSTIYYNTNETNVVTSFEVSKIKYGSFLQNLIRFLGKKLLTKNKRNERLGMIHSHIGSLNSCHLGINPGVRSVLNYNGQKDKKISTLFTLQLDELKEKKWLSTSMYTHTVAQTTNKEVNFGYDVIIPVKSLYEKNGFTYNIEGRLRRFHKVVTAPTNVRSVEAFLLAICRIQHDWYSTISSFWNLKKELPIKRY